MKLNEINQPAHHDMMNIIEIAELKRDAAERDKVIDELVKEVGILKTTLKNLIAKLGPRA